MVRLIWAAIIVLVIIGSSIMIAYSAGEVSATKFEAQTLGNATSAIQTKYIAAQTFTANTTHEVSYIRLYGYITGTPSYVVMQLRTTDGTGNITDDLVFDRRNPLSWSRETSDCTLGYTYFTSTGNGSWIDFALDHKAMLQANTTYAIVVKVSGGSVANAYNWSYDSGGNPYSGGQYWTSADDGETWAGNSSHDFMFEVWGQSGIFFEENEGVNIFQSFDEEGDWLICAAIQNVAPSYYPKGKIANLFRLQLIDNATGSSVAESVLRNWDAAPASIYINADQAATMQWGGNYTLRVLATYGGGFSVDKVLTADDWIGSTLDQLDEWSLAMATWCGIQNKDDGNAYLVSAGQGKVLNDDGTSLFSKGIPGLAKVRGQYIFQSFALDEGIDLNPVVTPNAALQSKYNWTTQLGINLTTALTDFGNPFNVGGNMVALAVILALYVAVVGGSFPAGHSIAGSVVGMFIIMIGMIAGVVNVVWLLLAGVIVLILALRQILLVGQ